MNQPNFCQARLLTREAFKSHVLGRSSGLCVFCQLPAVDAHHILDRKLFSDGGYRATNGAAVCALHHSLAETTRLSVERVLQAACVRLLVLPPSFSPHSIYDKWGNPLWPSGMPSAGPLAHDTGARRALAAGGVLSLLVPADYSETCQQLHSPAHPSIDDRVES